MSSELIDLTLPAHDPSFPKPRGLLPVPQEIEEAVAREEAASSRSMASPSLRKRGSECWTISPFSTTTKRLRCVKRTPLGVEVLAVGWEEASEFIKHHPPETRHDVRIGTV